MNDVVVTAEGFSDVSYAAVLFLPGTHMLRVV